MNKTVVHIISHSHWDREWYLAFEQHRMRLIELIDTAMELFEKDPAFRSFHLDGQTILLDDYLEIKPKNREKLEKYIKEGKFQVGPWYILQDEFLTSGEANVRNLLVGMKKAEEYGGGSKIGYFPDAFGNAGQMPQLLKQAGMKAVVFGRGVKPVGFNNAVMEGGEYESAYSEMNWESPDGSSLLGILFANWYNNGAEIPVEEKEAKAYWDAKLASARRFAGTRHLLLMNGCDHQPVQKDLKAAMETARKLYPEIEFVHSDFDTYVNAVSAELKEEISTVRGELTSQETDGRHTLVNTASAWADLKIMNRKGETTLEKKAEPIAVMAALQGKAYPAEFLRYSWKKLMQNHPHDSICSCSVDEVNKEVRMRFENSRQVADQICRESLVYLAGQIGTEAIEKKENKKILPFAVFNTTGWERTDMVSVTVDYERCYKGDFSGKYSKMEALVIPPLVLKDANGQRVEAKIEDIGVRFGYDLPDDKFRQPYMARQLQVTFEAAGLPAMGYRTYYLTEGNPEATETCGVAEDCEANRNAWEEYKGNYSSSLIVKDRVMENAYVRVEISEDGSYSLTDKQSGRRYADIGYYEDTGDVGNEYIFVQDKDRTTLSSKGSEAKIELVEDSPYRAIYRISHCLRVPQAAEELLIEERRQCKDIYDRKAGRSKEMVSLPVSTLLTLERGALGVKVETTIENTAKDHRIRVMIPTGLETSRHFADSMFEVAERNNRHSKAWKNPSGCDRQQSFVALEDGREGILVANFGLYEYEVLPDQENTIALTLLRSVGEMGDWGEFLTPGAQMQGTYRMRYEILPFQTEEMARAYQEAYQFQVSPMACCVLEGKGNMPLAESFLEWRGEGLNLTGLKKKEENEDIMVRFINCTKQPVQLSIQKKGWMKEAYRSNVIEENLGLLETDAENSFCMTVKPCEIATIGIAIKA